MFFLFLAFFLTALLMRSRNWLRQWLDAFWGFGENYCLNKMICFSYFSVKLFFKAFAHSVQTLHFDIPEICRFYAKFHLKTYTEATDNLVENYQRQHEPRAWIKDLYLFSSIFYNSMSFFGNNMIICVKMQLLFTLSTSYLGLHWSIASFNNKPRFRFDMNYCKKNMLHR